MHPSLTDAFLQEYTSPEALAKYTKRTAGFGISYLLEHDYRRVYADALGFVPSEKLQGGLRLLEFGCGAGMNLISLVSWLGREGVQVQRAIGTDFSPLLVEAARREATSHPDQLRRNGIEFQVARNERLADDLAKASETDAAALRTSFHFALGVNTMRYCHRTGTQLDCTRDILDLLAPGGVCVVIDMNDRFQFFRSSWRNRLRGESRNRREHYLPSLEDHATAFAEVGFEVLRTQHFCWIPHSSGLVLCQILRGAAPLLNVVARSRAMRSLVIARKPAVR